MTDKMKECLLKLSSVPKTAKELGAAGGTLTALVNAGLANKIGTRSPYQYTANEKTFNIELREDVQKMRETQRFIESYPIKTYENTDAEKNLIGHNCRFNLKLQGEVIENVKSISENIYWCTSGLVIAKNAINSIELAK